MKRILNDSFAYLSIEYIEFPSSVEEIGNESFQWRQILRSVTFCEDSKLKRIGNGSFSCTSFESIEIPSSVEKIGDES